MCQNGLCLPHRHTPNMHAISENGKRLSAHAIYLSFEISLKPTSMQRTCDAFECSRFVLRISPTGTLSDADAHLLYNGCANVLIFYCAYMRQTSHTVKPTNMHISHRHGSVVSSSSIAAQMQKNTNKIKIYYDWCSRHSQSYYIAFAHSTQMAHVCETEASNCSN